MMLGIQVLGEGHGYLFYIPLNQHSQNTKDSLGIQASYPNTWPSRGYFKCCEPLALNHTL